MRDKSPWVPDRPLFIGLAGGSGSGKTTVAEDLIGTLEGAVSYLQHDAYYRHMPELSYEERTRVNYDHPSSLETELIVEHLEQVLARNLESFNTIACTTHRHYLRQVNE